jgi:hypothetical protein
MEQIGIIGLELAKNVFQAHGAAPDGPSSFAESLHERSSSSSW